MRIRNKRGRNQRVKTIARKAANIILFAANIIRCCRRPGAVLENVRRIRTQLDGIEQRAQDYIRKIDDLGGALAAISRGYVQREIQESHGLLDHNFQ